MERSTHDIRFERGTELPQHRSNNYNGKAVSENSKNKTKTSKIEKKRVKHRSNLKKACETKKTVAGSGDLNIRTSLINATKKLYKGNRIAVNVSKMLTTPFETTEGLF